MGRTPIMCIPSPKNYQKKKCSKWNTIAETRYCVLHRKMCPLFSLQVVGQAPTHSEKVHPSTVVVYMDQGENQ